MNSVVHRSKLDKIQCCLSCLSRDDGRLLTCYELQSESLKSIFQIEQLCLCYICKRFVENAEHLIKTVISHQTLLKNLLIRNISDFATPGSNQSQTICTFGAVVLDAIQIDPNEPLQTDPIVYKHGVYREQQVKAEFECEDETSLDNVENDFLIHDTEIHDQMTEEEDKLGKILKIENIPDQELPSVYKKAKIRSKSGRKRNKLGIQQTSVKEEDLSSFLKEEVKVDELGDTKKIKGRRLNGKYSNNNINNLHSAFKIESFYITRAQCMEERARKAKEKKFLNLAYKCMDCVKGFSYKPSYDKHLELHSKEMGDYECDICKQRMDSEVKLLRHNRYHEQRFKCGECGLVRSNKVTIRDHYTAHHSAGATEPYVCHLCFKSFKRQLSLKKHVLYTHKNKGRVTCAYCLKTYANKNVLKAHLNMMHSSEIAAVVNRKKWHCEECGKSFKAPSQLKQHSIKHSHEREFYCVECDKSFKTEYSLKQHLKIAAPHVKYKDLPLICSHCEKRFAIKRDLETHMNRMHLNIRPFPCDKCDKAYLNTWSLKQHTQLAHEGLKRPLKYPCPMCDKVFDRNCILKGHIRTHTGERPFQCTKCPAAFSQSGILNTHVKLIHLKLTRDGRPKAALK